MEKPQQGSSAAVIAPEDRYYLIYWMFFLQGTTVLLAFNLFMKNMLFPAVFMDSSFAASYATWITWALMLTTVLSSLALTLLPDRYKMRPSRLIVVSWMVYGLVFFVCAMLPFSLSTLSPNGYFYIIMLLSLTVGAFSGVLQNSLYALAANLPPVFFQAISFGQGFSGLSTSLVMITYRSVNPGTFPASELALSTFALFFVGFLMIIASAVTFIFFIRSNYYQYYLSAGDVEEEPEAAGPEGKALKEGAKDGADIWRQLRTIFTSSPSRYYPLGIWFVFAVTFAVFPGFLVFTESSMADPMNPDHATYRGLFVTLGFLAFDLSDSIGKFLPGLPLFFIASHRVTLLSNLTRLIFIALFMWFNFIPTLNGQPFYPYATRWLKNDVLFFIVMFAFGLSNGYYGSLLLMKAASSLPENNVASDADAKADQGETGTGADLAAVRLREMMGKVMGLFLGFGLITGPCVAFLLQATLG